MINSGFIVGCLSTQVDSRLGVKAEQQRGQGQKARRLMVILNVFPSKGDITVGEKKI